MILNEPENSRSNDRVTKYFNAAFLQNLKTTDSTELQANPNAANVNWRVCHSVLALLLMKEEDWAFLMHRTVRFKL